jgi:membrane protease YdiL (CAAX protease family)
MELKPAPILKVIALMLIISLVIIIIDTTFTSLPQYENLAEDSSWILAILVHIPQFVIAFMLIWYISKGKLGLYGFNLKVKSPLLSHKRMLGLGLIVGLLMSIKYIPQILRDGVLDIPQPVTTASVIGNMVFQWIIVGVSEETLFRGLIQTYLMDNLEGFVNILGHNLHIGTVIGAVIWGAFHFINILVMPWEPVLFYVILTTIIGLPMGYAYQETGSLLTTVIVHNMIFGVPLTIGYILHWAL